jgi:hypothetical protein
MIDATRASRDGRVRPRWQDVHELIARLCAGRKTFATATSAENSIWQYEPGNRLMLLSERGSKWVAVDDVRGCWETFERLGSVRRPDLLEPGRCSAFMFALFAQLEGVDSDPADPERLVLGRR